MVSFFLSELNISAIIKVLPLSYSQYLKYFFKKILRLFRLLLIIFKTNLEKTFNIG